MIFIFLHFIYIYQENCNIMAQETTITPSISVKPNSSIPAGSNITIQCDGAIAGETFILYKNGREFLRQQSIDFKTEFLIVNVSLRHQGNYFCMMQSNSKISNHIRVAVQSREETTITPLISVKPNSSIPAGSNITIQCDGAIAGETFILYKNGREFLRQQSIDFKTEFLIVNVSLRHQGNYFCMMQSNSKISNNVRVAMQSRDMFLTALQLAWGSGPEIQASPSKVVLKGGNVTIICSSSHQGRFSLLRNRAPLFTAENAKAYEEYFTLTNVQEHNSSNYRCSQNYDQNLSDSSEFLSLKVIDPYKPSKSACVQGDNSVLVTCTTTRPPRECVIQHYFLYSGETQLHLWPGITITPHKKAFKVSDRTAEYRCSYVLKVKEQPDHWIESPLSDSVTPTKCEEFDQSGISFSRTCIEKIEVSPPSPFHQYLKIWPVILNSTNHVKTHKFTGKV
ncbi:immunoglobulin superfamily member 1-like [Phyllobates terribilis]|uniref:immunoglobulin superfamily member 1-like n=1 Tax=Phyllobates terribilis TaxID=111132 RepID=UPI003CCAFD64